MSPVADLYLNAARAMLTRTSPLFVLSLAEHDDETINSPDTISWVLQLQVLPQGITLATSYDTGFIAGGFRVSEFTVSHKKLE